MSAKSFLSNLEWRTATKKFDISKKLSSEDLNKIFESIRMSPTSLGMQCFKIYNVTNSEIMEKVKAVGWNQVQFTSASNLLVFVARTDASKRIDEYIDTASGGDNSRRGEWKGYEDMARGFVKGHSPEQIVIWSQRQVYIALGFAMAACAELGIDSCPMEGFDNKAVDKILGLPSNELSTVILTVGYRDPAWTPFKKFRFPLKDLLVNRS